MGGAIKHVSSPQVGAGKKKKILFFLHVYEFLRSAIKNFFFGDQR
jgi:hypothetical protein